MNIRRLRYFVAVAESLSFSRAATALGVTQPPVSQRVKELELELKAELLIRHNRGMSLTPLGARLLQLARPIVEEFDSIIPAEFREGEQPALSVCDEPLVDYLPEVWLKPEELCLQPGLQPVTVREHAERVAA